MTTENLTAWVAKITAAVIAAGTFYKKVAKPMYHRMRSLAKFYDNIQILATEMRPNGGSTLRDAVNRIETTVNRHEARSMGRQAVMNDLAPFGIFDTSEDGKVSYMNQIFSVWTGRPTGELMGWGWVNMISMKERRAVMEAWQEAIEEGRVFETRFNLVDYQGGEFLVALRATPVVNHTDGAKFGYRGIIQKIEISGNPGPVTLN